MIPEELEKLACAIADKVARRLGGPGKLTSGPEDLECFSCTGFKCKPNFSITLSAPAPTSPPSGSSSTGSSTPTSGG
jgi:hypothetical protein